MNNYLIVGASRGIGGALADLIEANNDHAITISRSGAPRGTTYTADVLTDELPLIDEPLNGLAYCPGSINLRPFGRLSADDFRADLEINLFGAIRTIQKYLPNLRESGNSSIVLFSTVAVKTGMGFHSSIAAAKGAIEGLTRSLAAEFAPAIRVNCIAPSLTDTPLADKLLNTPEKQEAAAKRHPLHRIGTPESIAEVAAFLLSGRSTWITGQVIHVDGGIGDLR